MNVFYEKVNAHIQTINEKFLGSEDERRRHPYSQELSRSVWDLKE
jgi:hypothetical protein